VVHDALTGQRYVLLHATRRSSTFTEVDDHEWSAAVERVCAEGVPERYLQITVDELLAAEVTSATWTDSDGNRQSDVSFGINAAA
jgi:hypothetical protein